MMIWLLRWWTSRFSYRRVATSTEEDDSTTQLSVVIGGAGADQGLPADVFARVVIPLLPVDDAVRLRAVGKAYGAQLIDEAFLLGRIKSCLAQQQLTGLINVERDRGADTSAPPLPAPLLRLGYLARCAYVIERAAEWRYMARFIRVASACGAAGQLPLVLSGESVAAHIPDKETFHRLPAAMAVYKTLGHQFGSDADNGSQQLTEGGRGETDVFIIPTNLLLRLLTAVVYVVYVLLWICLVVHLALSFYHDEILKAPHDNWLVLRWIGAGFYCIWVGTGLFLAAFLLYGRVMIFLLHARSRLVQWYAIGERQFRIVERNELWRPIFGRPVYCPSDPPVNTEGRFPLSSKMTDRVYRSFNAFALDTLLGLNHVNRATKITLNVSASWRAFLRYSAVLGDSFPCEPDMVVIDMQESEREPPRRQPLSYRPRRVVVLLLAGGLVASVHLGERINIHGHMMPQIEVATSEWEVTGGAAVTMARVRQLLRRFGLIVP
ncbi:unnamed protein product [Vitrella brassicaformis CCMP3155]|uniref:Uncharacterized protein n=1 Tax=Vitrella brassicaformis (strain CCMP3155) TaxID=1169540 RepID=A0A0G4EPJ3_VITBC|nr:unnamed protein product [Vitrella brassicaformis CCMP3155]|eukprot:CEL99359.1 unnamed protein product [Vitrella brassicaformis CCMP3155]